jgi:hypothetical protein
MSESRDEATGQFTPEPETYFGAEGVARDQGYVPMQDEPAEEDELTVAEAAQQLTDSRGTAENDIVTYSPFGDLAENVTMTIEQASKALTEAREADEAQATMDETKRLQKEIDELRGTKPEAAETKTNLADDPKFKEAVAIEAANHAKEADDAKQKYSAAVENADHIASSAFRAKFPELASQPVEQWQNVLATMAPERASEAMGTIQQLIQVKTALQQRQAEQAETERARFKAANDQFEAKIKDVPKERRTAVEGEIVSLLKERDSEIGDVAKFLRGIEGSNVALELLWELGETRAQLKAIKNAPKAIASRNLPSVVRPGTSRPAESGNSERLRTLNSKAELTMKEATELTTLRRQARG